MKLVVERINGIKPATGSYYTNLVIDCDMSNWNFETALSEICEQFGDEAFLEWAFKNIPMEIVKDELRKFLETNMDQDED